MKEHITDLVLLIPLIWGMIRGAMRGLVFEIAILIALALGLWGGFALAGFASVYLSGLFQVSGNTLHIISFMTVFIVLSVLIILLGKLLTGAISVAGLGIPNRIGGAVFGLCKWILIVSAILWLSKPAEEALHLINQEKKDNSVLYGKFIWLGKTMVPESIATRINTQKVSP